MTSADFERHLLARAEAANVTIDGELMGRLEAYFRLLSTWNTKINLTGMDLSELTDAAVDRLLIEPVKAARYAPVSARTIDIGSGGGSPAIPFALSHHASELVMVESREKKSVFLREAARATGLTARVETARFEELIAREDLHEAFGVLTVRAVRLDSAALRVLQHFVQPGGSLFLFHATAFDIAQLPEPLTQAGSHTLIPSLGSLLTIARKA